jgi:hypothetical protein
VFAPSSELRMKVLDGNIHHPSFLKNVKQILLCKMHMSVPLCRLGLNRATSK